MYWNNISTFFSIFSTFNFSHSIPVAWAVVVIRKVHICRRPGPLPQTVTELTTRSKSGTDFTQFQFIGAVGKPTANLCRMKTEIKAMYWPKPMSKARREHIPSPLIFPPTYKFLSRHVQVISPAGVAKNTTTVSIPELQLYFVNCAISPARAWRCGEFYHLWTCKREAMRYHSNTQDT